MARIGHAAQRAAPQSSTEAARTDGATPQHRRRAVAAADEELETVADRLEALLRQRHPSLFDRQGRLRRRALAAALTAETGRKTLNKDDALRLTERIETVLPAVDVE